MAPPAFDLQLRSAFRNWWREQSRQRGVGAASSLLVHELCSFLRDSTPERRRRRYGDMEYDWEHRVNTTSGTVGWRERLLGVFHSPYQPTDAALFQEMMASLPIDFSKFTFVDLGSGKGRTLLMASEYPFQRIAGVEILPELHRAAEENIANYRSTTQQCTQVESVCADASEFELPEGPLLLYLFNPLPKAGLRRLIQNLVQSLAQVPRSAWIVHYNPLLETAVSTSTSLEKVGGTAQYSVYRAAKEC